MNRKQPSPRFILALVLAAAVSCLALLDARAQPTKRTRSGKTPSAASDVVVALVNGAKIHQSDLERQVRVIQRNSPGPNPPSEADLALRKKALSHLIGNELLYQDSLSLGIKDAVDRKVEALLADFEKEFGSRENFHKQLAQDGMTLERLRRDLKRNLLLQAEVERRIVPKIELTEEEVQAFYQANIDRMKHDELVGARHILIRTPENATEEQKKTALEEISSLRRELAEGKDFAGLAREHSDCPSRERGGDLGYFARGMMVPEFEKAAFSLKEGELSEVIETAYGYHLILVYGRKPAGLFSFEEVRGEMERELKDKRIGEAVNAHIQKLRKTAKIRILDRRLAEKGQR